MFHKGARELKESDLIKFSLPLECTRIKMAVKESVEESCQ